MRASTVVLVCASIQTRSTQPDSPFCISSLPSAPSVVSFPCLRLRLVDHQ